MHIYIFIKIKKHSKAIYIHCSISKGQTFANITIFPCSKPNRPVNNSNYRVGISIINAHSTMDAGISDRMATWISKLTACNNITLLLSNMYTN